MLPLRPAAGLAASVLLVSLGALPALASPPAAAARTGGITGTSPAGVIVQMFDWPWTAIAAECTGVLGPDGYAAVQISPPQEAVVLAADGYPWWQAYQPVSYGLNSRFGTQAQLAAMITTCHAAGVKVYADVVLNHMTAQVNGGVGDNGTAFPDMYDYPPLYSAADFHSCHTSIANWDDESQVWNCELSGLADLDTGSSSVQNQEAAYLNHLLALGVDGFRWDSAKEMDPADIAAIEALLTRRDGGALSYTGGALYTLANVFMLGWDYGTPMVLSDYAFSGYDQGPPGAGGNAIAPPGCGSGTWECEQRWPAIAGMVGWHNAAGTAPVANWWSDGRDAIAFSRGSRAWAAINAESTPVTEDFSTGLAAGTYCDVISGAAAAGGCTGATITVGAGGQAVVTVPALSAAGIDVAALASAAAVAETVNVTVPAGTDATGDVVYLAGNLSALGPGVSNRPTARPGTP